MMKPIELFGFVVLLICVGIIAMGVYNLSDSLVEALESNCIHKEVTNDG